MNWNVVLMIAAICIAGCGGRPTKLERTASGLKPGMTKQEVVLVFSGFTVRERTNKLTAIQGETKLYGTNRMFASKLMFGPRFTFTGSLIEQCEVYFDTNDVIVAHSYEFMD